MSSSRERRLILEDRNQRMVETFGMERLRQLSDLVDSGASGRQILDFFTLEEQCLWLQIGSEYAERSDEENRLLEEEHYNQVVALDEKLRQSELESLHAREKAVASLMESGLSDEEAQSALEYFSLNPDIFMTLSRISEERAGRQVRSGSTNVTEVAPIDFDVSRVIDRKNLQGIVQDGTCCICREGFANSSVPFTVCGHNGHVFHVHCFHAWTVLSGHENCPMCRGVFQLIQENSNAGGQASSEPHEEDGSN